MFVKVRTESRRQGETTPALTEFHDIVYREAQQPGDTPAPPVAAPQGADWQRELVPDDVLLFRYSALTFNGHRIHYDTPLRHGGRGLSGPGGARPADRHVAARPAAPRAADAALAAFRFKALRPTFDGRPMRVHGTKADGRQVRLWACDHEGWLTMDATATLR